MKVKRFTGENMNDVMAKVKKELGAEAIILHTRTIKKSKFLGIIKKTEVEVIAALDTIDKKKKAEDSNDKLNSEIEKLSDYMKYIIENTEIKAKDENKEHISEELLNFVEILKVNGVREEVAVNIIKNIDKQVNLKNKDYEEIRDIVKLNIKAYLEEPEPIDTKEQKTIFFMGPTGVGKTTTIAKLASEFKLNNKKDVGLVTADTYRIAAVEQLKIYADILNIPLKVIYEVKEIYESISRFKDKDIVLIDTAGRSHKNIEQMKELEKLIHTVKNKEVFLVLNIGTDIENIKSIIKQYDFIDDFKIIFTKADESEKLGNILNTKFYIDNKLSYITNGQNVPDDIEVIDTEKISEILIGDNNYE